jgi:preprotein translocase subunit YajC
MIKILFFFLLISSVSFSQPKQLKSFDEVLASLKSGNDVNAVIE